jgi:hypothetical protein
VSTARGRPRDIATTSPPCHAHPRPTAADRRRPAADRDARRLRAGRPARGAARAVRRHPPGRRRPGRGHRQRLERAAGDLLYTSESDHPFTYVFRAGPFTAPLDVATFRLAFGVPADVPVEQVGLDDFFARHIERVDPADEVAVALVPRYRRLRETLRHTLREPRVFRVGRIAIDCEIVGTDAAGNVVGLHTLAIET